MADEHAQAQDHVWEAVDAAPDSPLPAPSFDEPLAWPETATFVPDDVRPVLPSEVWPEDATAPATPDGFPILGGDADQQWLDGLDLGALDHSFAGRNGTELDAERDLRLDPLPDSLWAADPVAEPLNQPEPPVVTSTKPAPTVYAEPSHRPVGGRKWLEVRHGNAAVVALISFVSLVLVGMFLSVRARNELPTDTSQSQTPTGEIAAQGPLNTIPTPTTAATTTTAPPPVAIADLIPGAEAGAGAGADGASAGTGSGGGGAGLGTTGTTAAPSRATGPSGGSGGGGSGSGGGAPAQPADTTPPTSEQPPTSPPATDPPVQDTTPRTPRTTSPPRTVPDISVPTITAPPEPTPTTSVTWPSFPDIPDIDD